MADRITPACAGSTGSVMMPPVCLTDHPRLRGEHVKLIEAGWAVIGSPPPARGAPGRYCPSRTSSRDHPRLRGEHQERQGEGERVHGSPPPARGARHHDGGRTGHQRITPACAGSTGNDGGRHVPSSDHPRLREEHIKLRFLVWALFGSPPPARGAPSPRSRATSCTWDHPRLRGEHAAGRLRRPGSHRITPACAGSTLLNQGCYVKERRISFTPSRSTGSHGPPVMRKSSPCSLRAA